MKNEFLSDEGSGFGLGPDALSAFSAYAPDMLHPLDDPAAEQMFPDGNGGFARMITKTLLPDAIAGPDTMEGVCRGAVNFGALDRSSPPTRIRLSSTVVWVQHDAAPEKSRTVTVAYSRAGKLYRESPRGHHGGRFLDHEAHRARPAGIAAQRDAYAQFSRSPACSDRIPNPGSRIPALLVYRETPI